MLSGGAGVIVMLHSPWVDVNFEDAVRALDG